MLLQENQRHYDEIHCNSTKTSIFSLKQIVRGQNENMQHSKNIKIK